MKKQWDKLSSFLQSTKNLTAMGSAQISATIISAVFWFYLASLTSVEEYGEINYLLAIASVAGVIAFLGSGNTLIVFTAKGEKISASIISIVLLSSPPAALLL